MKILNKIACFVLGHAWISKAWNRRCCNRCGKKQLKGAITGHVWTDTKDVIKSFNPFN